MNKLLITKQGFFDAWEALQNNAEFRMANLMGGGLSLTHIKPLLNTHNDVVDIISGEERDFVLNFPERFYPTVLAGMFWDKIYKLIEKGFSIEAKTSDLHSVTFVPVKRQHHVVGWDMAKVEYINPETGKKDYYAVGFTYGRRLRDLDIEF